MIKVGEAVGGVPSGQLCAAKRHNNWTELLDYLCGFDAENKRVLSQLAAEVARLRTARVDDPVFYTAKDVLKEYGIE